MDRKNTSACRGDEDHPFALSSKGGENPKNKSYNVRFDLLGIEDYEEETGDDVNVELSDELMLGRQVIEETNSKSEDAGENSRSKKKKKNKSGKTAHEEEDLDKILEELGITPVSPTQPELVPPADDGSKDGEEETVQSVSAKKRKKKKDKDKKVSASSVEAKDEPSQPHKKVPKHILEMQEMVARRKEAEEMKKKEEEEKLRKEEEEQRIQEEREREAGEIKQKRKIREKEKMLKKKQEGGILTEKQKRDKAFKNKMLSDAGMLLASDKQGDSSKRPVYGNKRKPARAKANDSASVLTKEKHADVVTSAEPDKKEEAGDEEDDWEAKSDDSVNIMGDYDDDGEDAPWLVVKKEIKDTASKAHYSGPVTDRLALKAGVSCKPQKSKPKVDDATRPKDATKRSNDDSEVNDFARESLRSPICCIMGHVDTGKTKLLDCIRGTNVQEGEAGGITQQIGATYFPRKNIRERTKELKADAKLKVPGLLVIDTPGHESFSNLRSRGSNLCDIAILVVDIMHGLEPQTIESLNLLRKRNTEFIVALNKVDRLYGWKTCKNAPIEKALALQSKDVVIEFNMRLTHVITQFKEQGLNTEIYYKNKEMGDTFRGDAFGRAHGGMKLFDYMGTDERFSKLFNQTGFTIAVVKKALEVYQGFKDVDVLVDVGGGVGNTLGVVTSKYPNIKGVNFDLTCALAQAPSYPGVEHVAGDMFVEVPKGDAMILKRILHDWTDEDCVKILKNCWKSLPENATKTETNHEAQTNTETNQNTKEGFRFTFRFDFIWAGERDFICFFIIEEIDTESHGEIHRGVLEEREMRRDHLRVIASRRDHLRGAITRRDHGVIGESDRHADWGGFHRGEIIDD
ncbi:hypothetical protein F2Q70_00040289 [Brassica cretica]|uniref:Tr-type G domain-containing protein n=1 Tax=Brassica cretica TaxID=69181 RepID=A0A8S9K7I8_BRACR|nr:hypothetical protein F2Q70_00040289 [Brassica cretica]